MASKGNQPDGNAPPNSGPSTVPLQQILAISTSLTNEESPNVVAPVDQERMKFFFNSLQSIKGSYQDDVEIIKQSLTELKAWSGADDTLETCVNPLQNIMDLVDHIDVASDFKLLGGFPAVSKFLKVSDPEIVRMAAEIIGISCQNHPKCQEAVIDDPEIFSQLFAILQSDKYADSVKLKAVFAISSTIQNNVIGHDKFKKMNGYNIFINALKVGNIPLRLRVCFVFDCLCSQFPEIKSILLEKQYVNCLVELLTAIPLEDSKETVLSAIYTFTEGFYDAISECKKAEYNLKPTLEYLIAHYKDDRIEEKEKAIRIKEELDRFSTDRDKK